MLVICLLLLSFFKQCMPAGYGSGVYGISWTNNALLYYNQTSQEVYTVAETNWTSLGHSSMDGALSMAALDPVNNIYYYVYSAVIELPNNTFVVQNGIYGYNLTDPSSLIKPILLPMFYQGLVDFAWQMTANQNNGDLYIFGPSNRTGRQRLVKIERKINDDGSSKIEIKNIKDYDNLEAVPWEGGQCTVYDTKREMLWIPSTNDDTDDPTVYYYYIDAKNGDISKKINFDYWPLDEGCNYDENLDKIIGMRWVGWNSINETFVFDFVIADPKNLDIKSNFPVYNNWCGSGGISTYESGKGIFYTLLYENDENNCGTLNFTDINGELLGINITNSDIVSEMTICKEIATKHIIYMDYPNDIRYWKGVQN